MVNHAITWLVRRVWHDKACNIIALHTIESYRQFQNNLFYNSLFVTVMVAGLIHILQYFAKIWFFTVNYY